MRWFPHVTVAAVIEQNNKFLLVHETVDGKNVINQPAGHLEDKESLLDAIKRETLEETCWHFTPSHLIGIYQWRNERGNTFIRYCFAGQTGEHDAQQQRDPVINDVAWYTLEETESLSALRSPMVLQCIKDYVAGQRADLDIIKHIT